MSSDWCYPLCALVTLVLRLVGFDNPCRLGTEMVSLVGVIRLVHILLPVPYTHRVARVRYIHALRRLTTIVDSGLALTVTWWGTGGVQVASLNLRPLHLPFSSKSRAGPSVPGGRRASGTARAVLHACPCSFWNWRLVYYSTS